MTARQQSNTPARKRSRRSVATSSGIPERIPTIEFSLGAGESADFNLTAAEALDKKVLLGEIRRLQDANEQLLAELRRTTEGGSAPFYTSAHDLKTPLCTLESVVDALLQSLTEEKAGEQSRNLARLVELTSKRMRCLVDDLLDLGRVGSHADLDELVDLGEIVTSALDRNAAMIESNEVFVQVTGTLPIVRAPRRDLRAVVANIVENAVKYAPAEGRHTIAVGADETADGAVVWVRDTGCGFAPAKIEEAFQAYVRCNSDIDGTGLGLAIVKKAVDGWGGRVWIETAPGTGTTVSFTVPSAKLARNVEPNAPRAYRQEELT